ncbi:hypothetical protein PYCCODRAFT_1409557 [Trametes coccinea BRFM310]|uniref:Uncharacterized protein n=1 Tax=Trametes coccinea (strain BRFM310) TaxID=1353009 RepID=A0A1Y2IQ33_TRAC3|nr:hypothetical protein PYCCODRAFT_1409557 [Trametes coccinea BRFM310]
MSPALSSQPSTRPWWSRSKPSKEQLRANRSFSSLQVQDDSEKYTPSSPTSPKHKDGLPSLKFNTLASAIGFKSKKLPALTIQDPPSPVAPSLQYNPQSRPGTGSTTPSTADHSPFFTNRPPAKSVSTVRSSEYDFDAASDPHTTSEPRTPSDHPRDRMSYQTSVMTFSEIDPFASGGIVVQHLPQDPNRLSVYSDSSMLDPHHQKKGDLPHNRRSYGSSSSNSHGTSSDGQALSPLSPSSFGRRSAYDLTQPNDASSHRAPSTHGHPSQRTRRTKTPSGSNSSNSTVTPEGFRNRLSEPGAPNQLPRKRSSPSLRPRGMTVAAVNVRDRDSRPDVPRNVQSPDITLSPIQPLQIRRKPSGSSSPSSSSTPSPSPVTFTRHRNDSTVESPVEPSPTRPLVLVRKASSSRVKLPPLHSAPPMSDLPPPPPVPRSPHRDYDLSPLEFRNRNSSSSSLSLNFAPSIDGFHDVDNGDAISQLMHNAYDLGPFEMREPDTKGKRKSHRNTYILDGDLSPTANMPVEASLPSPLSKFPPVPAFIHGDLASSKASKLLKKMSSQQNLGQRNSAASWASSASHDDASTHSHSSGKHARKQRSFHHPRVPLPPLPGLRGGSSAHPSASAETLPAPTSPVVEPRRSSVTSPRKRLFSGSSARRSTSSHGPTSPSTEDDGRSILSLDTESRPGTSSATDHITLSFGNSGAPLSIMTRNACISPASLWDDSSSPGGGDGSSKRTSQSEYMPQYIMSPAEQLRLAEKLADEEAFVREQPVREPETERKPKLDLQPSDFGLAFLAGKNQSQNQQRQEASSRSVRSRSNSVLSYASTGTLAFGNGGSGGIGGTSGSGNGLAGEFGSSVSRGASVLSASSKSASGWHSSTSTSFARPATSPRKMSLTESVRGGGSGGGPARSSSMLARSLNKPPPISARPSTAQPSLTPPTSPTTFAAPASHSPEMPSTSLPPPPRRKPSRHDLNEPGLTGKRASVVPMNPLSPPPIRPRPRRQPSNDSAAASQVTPSRPPSAFDRQKVLQRRSLMKKPSFLDIEDEADMSAENDLGGGSDDGSRRMSAPPSPRSPSMESSFLDMDRKDSFDTVRSAESAFCVY